MQDKLSHIEEVIYVTDEVQIEVLPASVTNVTDELLDKGNSDTDAVLRGGVPTAGCVATAGKSSSTSSDSDDDDFEPTVLDLKHGSMFASAQILLSQLSEYANKQNFTVRREKHAIVCSNAGTSNWTGVTDYESRAEKAYRKNNKHQDQNDQDGAESLQNFLTTEEDKVATLHQL